MTVEELLSFIESELGAVKSNPFYDRAITAVKNAIAKRPEFLPEKFKDWFVSSGVVFKNAPLAFLSKCGVQDINEGKFDRLQGGIFDLNCLCEIFRRYDIKIGCETSLIQIVEGYILEKGFMTPSDLRSWNNEAIGYLIKTNKKTTKDFVTLFDKSVTMKKLKLPLKDMKKEAEEVSKEWSEIMKQLEDTPPVEISESEGENHEEDQIDNPPTKTC